MHTKRRQDDTHDNLQEVLGDAMISCDIEMVGPEITACSQGPSFLPPAITDDKLNSDIDERRRGSPPSSVTIDLDNSLSPSHTLVQIVCQDHKGLLYDLMRTLKDYNIQVCMLANPGLGLLIVVLYFDLYVVSSILHS